ncbi:MAG: DUF2283 domain-containing protein [Candidatus Komeilibacteria bacterium]
MIKVSYDKSVDAAYIYFQDPGGKVSKTYPCDPKEIDGMINLDFDDCGILVGLEIIGASKKLPKDLVENADII